MIIDLKTVLSTGWRVPVCYLCKQKIYLLDVLWYVLYLCVVEEYYISCVICIVVVRRCRMMRGIVRLL